MISVTFIMPGRARTRIVIPLDNIIKITAERSYWSSQQNSRANKACVTYWHSYRSCGRDYRAETEQMVRGNPAKLKLAIEMLRAKRNPGQG